MKRYRAIVLSLSLAAGAALAPATAAAVEEWPKFDEVYQLLRSHLGSVNEVELNRLAIEGLISKLEPRAMFVSPETVEASGEPTITFQQVFENAFACIRFSKINRAAADGFPPVFQQLSSSNTLRGMVLDLRFADGTDYEAAARIADQFVASERPLIDWGTGSARSTGKSNAITLPLVVLVNAQTSGAAEALAAVLRETNIALIIGATSAGQANVYQAIPLEGGHQLRIASGKVKVGSGKVLSEDGIQPDIEVRVSAEAESAYFEDPFAIISNGPANLNETSRPSRRRTTEADLVRQQRELLNPEAVRESVGDESPVLRIVSDPALARGLDVLKGISIVRRGR